MKFLKYFLIVVAILVVGFFLLGIAKPEISYNCEVMVDKPLAESMAVSQDESKLADWLDGYQKTVPVSGTPGTVGAVSDVHFVTNGEAMVIRETITGIVPNESISMNFASDFMDMDYQLNMSPVDGKTKIHSTTTAVGNGMMAKSIMVLISGTIEQQEVTNLANLKKTIENNTTQY